VDLFPDLYRTIHPWLAPLFSSSLAATTIFALGLNLLFRLGIASRATLELVPGGETSDAIFTFMDSQGGKWGARREVIQKATGSLNELYEAVSAGNLSRGNLTVDALFDELNLELTIRYEGRPLEFPGAAPSREELLDDQAGVARMAAFLIRRMADRVKVGVVGESCTVHLHFEH
jgi:NCS2 family nucleobase:cation symporter-2